MKNVFFIILLLSLASCGCHYLPLIRYPLASDYSKMPYKKVAPAGNSVLNDKYDSLRVSVAATAYIPAQCRAEKLNLFWARLEIKVLGDGPGTISINPNESSVVLTSDTTRLSAEVSASIRKYANATNLVFYKEPGSYHQWLKAEFHYSDEQKSMLTSHRIMVDLKRIRIGVKWVAVQPVTFELSVE